jgi:periplasmic protein CpxP/Spy
MERALGPRGDHGRWWNDQTMIDKLKLTDEQRKAMDGILMDHRTKLVDLRANLDKAELVMEPLMSSEQPNEAAILAQIDKVAMARAELEKANARFLLAIRGKLTPEQWKILQTDRRTHMDKGGPGGRLGGHGEGRPMPPPPGGPMGKVDDDGPDDAGQPANGLPQ